MTAKRPENIARVGATYEHFKGARYKILAIAIHSETGESLVVYHSPEGIVWARPREMFEDGRYRRVEE